MSAQPTLAWPPPTRPDADVNEVPADWVAAHRDGFRLVDIREPHELEGPLGRLDGVENIPMLQLLSRSGNMDKNAPLVLICRSGRRSGQVTRALLDLGFRDVHSVEGGMIAWRLDVDGREGILADEKVANTTVLAEAVYRSNGLPEVSAGWVAKNFGRFHLVDIRERAELSMTGKVAQAEHVPMGTFLDGAQKLDRSAPLVVMCASGGRSGRVVRALESAGFTAVASLEGGIMGWRASGLPTVHL